jgi:hypothetical protein
MQTNQKLFWFETSDLSSDFSLFIIYEYLQPKILRVALAYEAVTKDISFPTLTFPDSLPQNDQQQSPIEPYMNLFIISSITVSTFSGVIAFFLQACSTRASLWELSISLKRRKIPNRFPT